jgi:hypothetical protein
MTDEQDDERQMQCWPAERKKTKTREDNEQARDGGGRRARPSLAQSSERRTPLGAHERRKISCYGIMQKSETSMRSGNLDGQLGPV